MGKIRHRKKTVTQLRLEYLTASGELTEIYSWIAKKIWELRIGYTDTKQLLAGDVEISHREVILLLLKEVKKQFPHLTVGVRTHIVSHIWRVTMNNADAKMETLPDGHIEHE